MTDLAGRTFGTRYDKHGDVLYVSAGRKPAIRGVEDSSGIVWRYDAGGEVISATVIGFRNRWGNDIDNLIRLLEAGFEGDFLPTHPHQRLPVQFASLEGKIRAMAFRSVV